MSAATMFSVGGLALDIVGAWVLLHGVLRRDMANLRAMHAVIGQESGREPLARRLALSWAFSFGSRDTGRTTPDYVGAYVEAFWGLILLGLGFLGQLIGQVVAH